MKAKYFLQDKPIYVSNTLVFICTDLLTLAEIVDEIVASHFSNTSMLVETYQY